VKPPPLPPMLPSALLGFSTPPFSVRFKKPNYPPRFVPRDQSNSAPDPPPFNRNLTLLPCQAVKRPEFFLALRGYNDFFLGILGHQKGIRTPFFSFPVSQIRFFFSMCGGLFASSNFPPLNPLPQNFQRLLFCFFAIPTLPFMSSRFFSRFA